MMSAVPTLLVFVLMIVLCFPSSHSLTCSCTPSSLQDTYCNANFAVRVLLTSRGKAEGTDGQYYYKLEDLQTLRFDRDSGYKKANKTLLWTGGSSRMCGVHLKVGLEYIITGHVFRDRLEFNRCGWHADWTSLTVYQKLAVQKAWRKACGHCKIKLCHDCRSCFGQQCSAAVLIPHLPEDTCMLKTNTDDWQCYQKWSVCRKKNGRCRFIERDAVQLCQNKVLCQCT